jgi:hypothetical protein
MSLEICVLNNSEISFVKKVSSEGSYDYLRFYIDDTEKGAWDGDQDWSIVTFPIIEGVHTLSWSFEKDYSVSTGSDCGWIDFITFPPFGDPNPQISYDPESFLFTVGNEFISDTITITNEGIGPLIYSINVVDTLGNNPDWLLLDVDNGGLNAGDSDDVHVDFDATDLEQGNYVAYITITDHMENDYVIPVFMFVDIASAIQNQELISKVENIPNPFSNKTTIFFTLEETAPVTITIYNLQGEEIRTLVSNAEYQKGEQFIIWNTQNEQGSMVEAGVYFYRIKMNENVVTGKMILKN